MLEISYLLAHGLLLRMKDPLRGSVRLSCAWSRQRGSGVGGGHLSLRVGSGQWGLQGQDLWSQGTQDPQGVTPCWVTDPLAEQGGR